MARSMDNLQRLGRALMLPIAVLPVAALLLRLGQPDLLGSPVLAAAGNAIFSNLGLVFAVGVAVGFARENHGAAGLASLVGFLVATQGAEALLTVPPSVTAGLADAAAAVASKAWRAEQMAKLSMPVGVLSGLIAGYAYNRFSEIRLPSYLAFFGGRRFVPIATGAFGVLVALAFGYAWPLLARGMDAASHGILSAGSVGLFIYGALNRLLIVTGLHHILNNLAWFLLGDYHGVTGDLKRFFAGDPSAGAFMSGFFPVMMFGLPGACLAMYRSARPERRRMVGGLLVSIGLTSFLTGVTEPIEYTFMFLAPLLYVVHAVLTGLAMVIMNALGVKLGFGFSAGLFDYVLNFKLATRPLWLLPVGFAYFGIYYALFRYGIVRFKLATPGREPEEAGEARTGEASTRAGAGATDNADDSLAARLVAGLGGAANLRQVDACTTRLRLVVADSRRIDQPALMRAGAHGVVTPSPTAVQVVLGPQADQVAGEIRAWLQSPKAAANNAALAAAPVSAPPIAGLCAALGGTANIRALEQTGDRLLVALANPVSIDPEPLRAWGIRGIADLGNGRWHLLTGPATERLLRELELATGRPGRP